MTFVRAKDQEETDAFLKSIPQGPPGRRGQLVLYAVRGVYEFAVDRLALKTPIPLGDSGVSFQMLPPSEQAKRFRLPILELEIHAQGKPPYPLRLVAGLPEVTRQDDRDKVYGTYWLDPRTADEDLAAQGSLAGGPRVNLFQATDGTVYYRVWNGSQVEAVGPVAMDGEPLTLFGEGNDPTRCYLEPLPNDQGIDVIELLPFAPKKPYRAKTRQVRLRLTVDGRSEEFWLEELDPAHMRRGDHQQRRTASERVVAGTGRRVAATMAPYSVELGFDVYLREFERRLDPGTSMASKYSSLVDLYARDSKAESRRDESAAPTDAAAGKVLAKDLLINLNAPQDVRDPFNRPVVPAFSRELQRSLETR